MYTARTGKAQCGYTIFLGKSQDNG